MAILKDNVIPQQSSTPKDIKLKRITNQIKNVSIETFNSLINTQRRGIDLLWNDEDLTPQEIIDELGEDAVKVFIFHGKLTELILGLAGIDNVDVQLKLPSNAFTIDQLGKITVTKDPYKP